MDVLKADVKFGEWVRKGLELFKDNIVLLIVASVLAIIIGGATGGILSGPMFAGMILIVLALVDRKAPKPDVGAVFKGFDYFLNAFLFWLIWGILYFVAMSVLSSIPYIGKVLGSVLFVLLETFLLFGLFLIVDRKMEFWPASMESVNRVKPMFFPMLGLVVIISLFNLLGLMACGVGLIVTVPITLCCLAVAYRDIFGPAPAA